MEYGLQFSFIQNTCKDFHSNVVIKPQNIDRIYDYDVMMSCKNMKHKIKLFK
jgi:hypothetical protein